eukprot:11218070-Alexandrium_andersonii.AAC.1
MVAVPPGRLGGLGVPVLWSGRSNVEPGTGLEPPVGELKVASTHLKPNLLRFALPWSSCLPHRLQVVRPSSQ